MKKLFKILFFVLVLVFIKISFAQENEPNQTYFLGKVLAIESEGTITDAGSTQYVQKLKVQAITGPEKGNVLLIEHGSTFTTSRDQRVNAGEYIVAVRLDAPEQPLYFIADRFRIPSMLLILFVFFALVVALSRFKGLNSFVGLFFTIVILAKFIVPQILAGHSPLVIALLGAVATAFISLYMAHGINIRTTLSLISTLITLFIAALLAVVFVNITRLFGAGSEEAFFLLIRSGENINLRGILLAGIIIGALGVLDDITTAQTATVDELKKANNALNFIELYKRGISVGKEHIASLVNTLVLAYAGSSMPLFLIFSIDKERPLWMILNSEFVAEEVIRTLVGSMALVLAVPIATAIAAWYFSKYPSEQG